MNIFKNYYIDVFTSRYIDFSGRASRGEFWYFTLFNLIISILAYILDMNLGTTHSYEATVHIMAMDGSMQLSTVTQTIGYISSGYGLIALIPSIAIGFRRLHDVNKSAWWFLIALIPLIGFFIIIYFYIKRGDEEENKFGPEPQYASGSDSSSKPKAAKAPKPVKEKKERSSGGSFLGKLFKFIIFLILLLAGAAAGLYYYFGTSLGTNIYTIKQTIMDEVNNQNVIQSVEDKGKEVYIRLPLTKKYEVQYNNLALCKPATEDNNIFFKQIDAGEFGTSSVCVKGKCEVSVDLNDMGSYPPQILAYVKDSGVCIQKSIPTKSKPAIKGYQAVLEMTQELLDMLQIVGGDYKVSLPKSKSLIAWKLIGTKKIAILYKEKIDTDTLVIDGKKRAVMLYGNAKKPLPNKASTSKNQTKVAKATTPPKDELKALEEKIEALKQEKRVLMMKLDMNK